MSSKNKESRAAYEKRWAAANRDKRRAANKRWRQKNPDKVRARNQAALKQRDNKKHAEMMRAWRKENPRAAKNADLKKSFGITIDEYEQKVTEQNGRCASCRQPPGKRALAVDHCHATGKVRGLLCAACNTALGLLRECPLTIQALRSYVERWS